MAARCTATDQAIEACGGDPRAAAAAAAAGVKFFTSPIFSIDRFARSGQFPRGELSTRAVLGQTSAPTHAPVNRFYPVMLLTQFLS